MREERVELEFNGGKQLFVLRSLKHKDAQLIRRLSTTQNLTMRPPKVEFDMYGYQTRLAAWSIVEPADYHANEAKLGELDDEIVQKLIEAASRLNAVSPLGSGSLELPSQSE